MVQTSLCRFKNHIVGFLMKCLIFLCFSAALRKDKSLGIMSQKFLMLFLVSKVIKFYSIVPLITSCAEQLVLFQLGYKFSNNFAQLMNQSRDLQFA